MEQDLRYPMGRFNPLESMSEANRDEAIGAIQIVPEALREALEGLSLEQFQTPYRPGGWTV